MQSEGCPRLIGLLSTKIPGCTLGCVQRRPVCLGVSPAPSDQHRSALLQFQMKFKVDSSQRIPRARRPVSAGGGGARSRSLGQTPEPGAEGSGSQPRSLPSPAVGRCLPWTPLSLAKPCRNRTADCHPPDPRGDQDPLTSPGCQVDLTELDRWSLGCRMQAWPSADPAPLLTPPLY